MIKKFGQHLKSFLGGGQACWQAGEVQPIRFANLNKRKANKNANISENDFSDFVIEVSPRQMSEYINVRLKILRVCSVGSIADLTAMSIGSY